MTTTHQLDATNERILKLLAEGESQKAIGMTIRLDRTNVNRRVRQMKKMFGANSVPQLLLLVNKNQSNDKSE